MVNTTALAIIQADELETIQRTGKLLAASGYFDAKGDNPQAIAMMATKILAGREMGFGPFASVNGVHIIQGKPAIGANLLAAAVKGSGRYNYRVKVMTADLCSLEFFEREGDKWISIGVSDFSKEDAKAAGTQNMVKFARNMLFARAMSNGVRWFCPDVFSGNAVYVPEELGAEVDGDGNVISGSYTVTQPAQPAQKPADVVFDKPAMQLANSSQLAHLETIGYQYYGDKWPAQQAKWAAWASGDKVAKLESLTPEQADAVMERIEHRMAAHVSRPEAVGK